MSHHLPTCSRFCAITHCVCGGIARHGSTLCGSCARKAYDRKAQQQATRNTCVGPLFGRSWRQSPNSKIARTAGAVNASRSH
jgi:hypothetical protein